MKCLRAVLLIIAASKRKWLFSCPFFPKGQNWVPKSSFPWALRWNGQQTRLTCPLLHFQPCKTAHGGDAAGGGEAPEEGTSMNSGTCGARGSCCMLSYGALRNTSIFWNLAFFGVFLHLIQWFSKCSSETSSISITWEQVRNAHSQAPPRASESETQECVLTSPPGNSRGQVWEPCIWPAVLLVWSSNCFANNSLESRLCVSVHLNSPRCKGCGYSLTATASMTGGGEGGECCETNAWRGNLRPARVCFESSHLWKGRELNNWEKK